MFPHPQRPAKPLSTDGFRMSELAIPTVLQRCATPRESSGGLANNGKNVCMFCGLEEMVIFRIPVCTVIFCLKIVHKTTYMYLNYH